MADAALTLPPTLPGAPVLGSLLEVRRDMLALFERAATLGDVVRIRFPGRVGYLVVHPDQVKQVLVDQHRSFGKQTRGYQMLRLALGQGLVTSEGEFWRRQRRIAQPAFHHQRIQAFADIMATSTEAMLERWGTLDDGASLDVDEQMMALTLRIVGLALMGVDLTDATDRVGGAVTAVLEETVYRIVHVLSPPVWVPTRHNRRLRAGIRSMHETVGGLIRSRRATVGEHGDLLDMLMAAKDEETGESMTDRQLLDEAVTMVSAGHETTANALSWTFHLLASAPEAQAKLHEEVDRVLGDDRPSAAHLPELEYTEAVVKESMRLRPPVWMIARSVEADDVDLGGFSPDRGNMVFLSTWVTHRDPRFWKDPLQFRPERFLSGELEGQPKYAYFPFAGGPRVCIGNAFATMEAKLLLAAIARRFRLEAQPGFHVEPEPTITLRPRGGLRMILRRR